MDSLGSDAPVPQRVRMVTAADADRFALRQVAGALRAMGAKRIVRDSTVAPMTVRIGTTADTDLRAGLRRAGVRPPRRLHAEGYVLTVAGRPGSWEVTIAGADRDGTYYGAQTFAQLAYRYAGTTWLAGVRVVDWPSIPVRGVVEGFYGPPWSHAERMDQLAFYGDNKMNTYIYAPKGDPYHRERWRVPYPRHRRQRLGELVERARAHHVDFVFSVSPGLSICYTRRTDRRALTRKIDRLHTLGARDFVVAFDDISYTGWNCAKDGERYGRASAKHAARAHVDLMNRVRGDLIKREGDADGGRGGDRGISLRMVPTDYFGTADSGYRRVLRNRLDARIGVLWTGADVIPPEVTVRQARAARRTYGRQPLLWENFPVNDYPAASGRLLLAPYDHRSRSLPRALAGVVANPMSQADASEIPLFTVADYAWNPRDYVPPRSVRQAIRYMSAGDHPLTGDDERLAGALRVFADLNHLTPTLDAPAKPQAPELASRIDTFWRIWKAGNHSMAIRKIRPYAESIQEAPRKIRKSKRFAADVKPWLGATRLCGRALVRSLDATQAEIDGRSRRAARLARQARRLTEQARAISAIGGASNAPVRVGDGVLDRFIEDLLERVR